jgi:predicted kinase
MKTMYILRGLPGSGKSTFAKSIAKPWQIFEADQYFMNNGEYEFDVTKLKDAHQDCKDRVRNAMRPSLLRGLLYNTIVVSNTFTQEWEMKFYRVVAKKYGYRIFYVIIENRHGNTNEHGVPEDKIQIMKDRFVISL